MKVENWYADICKKLDYFSVSVEKDNDLLKILKDLKVTKKSSEYGDKVLLFPQEIFVELTTYVKCIRPKFVHTSNPYIFTSLGGSTRLHSLHRILQNHFRRNTLV